MLTAEEKRSPQVYKSGTVEAKGLTGVMCSTANDWVAKHSWLRQYSQSPRARDLTASLRALHLSPSLIRRGPDSQLRHQDLKRFATEICELHEVLDPFSLQPFHLVRQIQ